MESDRAGDSEGTTPSVRVLVGLPLLGYCALSVALVVTLIGYGRHILLSPTSLAPGAGESAPQWVARTLLLLVATTVLGRHLLAWYHLSFMRRPMVVKPSRHATSQLRVAVVTTFVPEREPLGMLEESLAALVDLRGEHDTWVLDEGADPAVLDLCGRLGARYFTRAGVEAYQAPQGVFQARSKHGNLNAWLDQQGYRNYDVLCQFDADHVPEPQYLGRVLPFLARRRVGLVACPCAYQYGPSLAARAISEDNSRWIATAPLAAYGLGCVLGNGSHMTTRVAALREIGGVAAHGAEDSLTSLRLQAAGWEGVYLPEILARGRAPATWKDGLAQLRRWVRSDVDLRLRHMPSAAPGTTRGPRLIPRLFGMYFALVALQALGLFAGVLLVLGAGMPRNLHALVGTPWCWLLALLLLGCQELRGRFHASDPSSRGWGHRTLLWHLVRWPILIEAVAQGLRGGVRTDRVGANLTPKSRNPETSSWLWAHVVILAALLVASATGAVLGVLTPRLLVFLVAVLSTQLFVVLVTGPVGERATPHHPAGVATPTASLAAWRRSSP